ncbi:MAG: N-acetylmuramoyl-L-alanine amidase, partial [Minisyncoccia bacterium]
MKKTFLALTTLFFFMPTFFAHATAPIKILLVPGHDNQTVGAVYGNLKETDMNLDLATRIFNTLSKDPRFEVHITRDSSG